MFRSQTRHRCLAAVVGASLVVGGLAVATPAVAAPPAPAASGDATPTSTFTVTSSTEFAPGQPVTLAGTALPGERITITLPRFETASVTAGADGTWSYLVEQEWDASPQKVTFERSEFTKTIEQVLVPQGSKPFDVAGADTFTPGDRPTFSGTGAIGDIVSVVLPAFEGTATAKIGADATWSITATTAWDASPQKLVFSTAYTGHAVEKTYSPEGSRPLTFSGSEHFTPGGAIALTGTGAVGDVLTLTLPNRDQAVVTVGADGTWSHTFDRNWVAAPYTITARSSLDGTTAERTYTPAGSKPFAFDGPSTFTPGTAIALSGTGAIGDSITLTLPSHHEAHVTVGTDGTWSHTFDRTWTAAPHAITARSSLTGTTTERTYNPIGSKPFAFDGPSTFTPGTAIALSGTGAAGDRIALTLPTHHQAHVEVGADGTWSHTFDRTWAAAEYKITARSSLTGETTSKTFTPAESTTLTVTSPTYGGVIADGANLVTWTGTAPAGTPVQIATTGGRSIATATADTNGRWAARGTLAFDLMYTVNVSASTNGGDTVTEHAVKVTKPFEVTSPTSGATVEDAANFVTWTGTAPAGTPIHIATTGGRSIATAKADKDGIWAARGTLAYDIMYTVNVTATMDGEDTTTEHQVKVVKP